MKKYGLFIGVDEYDDPGIPSLSCAARDAREMASSFKHKLGFVTEVLTHDELKRGRRPFAELRRIGRELGPGDIFVFFFAGHGKTAGDKEQTTDQLFLLPDASGRALERGITAGDGLLSYRALRAETDDWVGVQRAFILDACRMPLRSEEAHTRDGNNLARFQGEVVYRDATPNNSTSKQGESPFVILNSCQDEQRAEELEHYPGGHGLFSASILETLEQYAHIRKPVILDDSFTAALTDRMRQLARQYGNRETTQSPLRVGAELRLFGIDDMRDKQVAALLVDFDRQIAAGQLDRPVGDNCHDTLSQLATRAYDRDAQQALSIRLQTALDQREQESKRQRDQQRIEAARRLGNAAAYVNYLAACELCEHKAEADAAIDAEKAANETRQQQSSAQREKENAAREADAVKRHDAERDAAEKQRQEAERKIREAERADIRKADEDAWRRATNLDTEASYAAYLGQHSNGSFRTRAEERHGQKRAERLEQEMRDSELRMAEEAAISKQRQELADEYQNRKELDLKEPEQNKKDEQDKQQQEQQQQQGISKDDAQRLLNALANDEKNVQEKVKLAKAAKAKVKTVKNW